MDFRSRETLPVAHKPTFDTERMAEDMALKGWAAVDLANAAGVSPSGVSLFLRNLNQTARMAAKLSAALGYSIRRYYIPTRRAA